MLFIYLFISIKLSFSQILDTDGIASPGEIVRPHDILINKQSATVSRDQLISHKVLPDRLVVLFLFSRC